MSLPAVWQKKMPFFLRNLYLLERSLNVRCVTHQWRDIFNDTVFQATKAIGSSCTTLCTVDICVSSTSAISRCSYNQQLLVLLPIGPTFLANIIGTILPATMPNRDLFILRWCLTYQYSHKLRQCSPRIQWFSEQFLTLKLHLLPLESYCHCHTCCRYHIRNVLWNCVLRTDRGLLFLIRE